MLVQDRLHQCLEKLEPLELEIINESEAHRGHAEAASSGESHFFIRIVSQKFAGLSLIEQHRLVYQCLAGELARQVHALRLETSIPQKHV